MSQRSSGIVPCKIDTCRYPTRPHRSNANQYAFPTRSRRKGMCHVCHYKTLPKPVPAPPKDPKDPDNPPHPETIAAHNAFLAGRRAREAVRERRQIAADYPHLARSTA